MLFTEFDQIIFGENEIRFNCPAAIREPIPDLNCPGSIARDIPNMVPFAIGASLAAVFKIGELHGNTIAV